MAILGMHTDMAASHMNSCKLIRKRRKNSVFTSGQIMIQTVVWRLKIGTIPYTVLILVTCFEHSSRRPNGTFFFGSPLLVMQNSDLRMITFNCHGYSKVNQVMISSVIELDLDMNNCRVWSATVCNILVVHPLPEFIIPVTLYRTKRLSVATLETSSDSFFTITA